MKKTLLLSVVASSMIMAGGDIAPVEPVVETPAPVAEASGWDFGGQAVAYTQTVDQSGDGSLFDEESTYAAVGLQLRATNKDIWNGIGAGVELSGIHSDDGTASGFYGNGGNAGKSSAGLTQGYLTYGIANTSLKLGRQTLPKSLSPFAYSEGWQVFKNTFDAALVVNSDLPDTTLVYAFVKNHNRSVGEALNERAFLKANGSDGIHMVTAQNKSIEGLTLTGTYYFGGDYMDNHGYGTGDVNILWGDAKFKVSDFSVALQGGQIDPDGVEATTAFGAKVGYNFGMFGASVAYSTVDEDGVVRVSNVGTGKGGLVGVLNSVDGGVKSPLYTQMVLNNVGQYHAQPGSDFIKLSANAKALGGKFIVNYGMGDNSAYGDYSELDLMYKAKLTDNITGFAAYVYTDEEGTAGPSDNNFLRFWARYNF